MRHLVSALALVALFSPSARAADGLEGNNVTFYINHVDTPPSDRPGLSHNIMRGTLWTTS